MGSKSNYLENALLNQVLKGTAFTQPAALYVSLHTADPGELGDQGEVSGNGYQRVQHDSWTITGSSASNNGEIAFPESTASWGTVDYFGIWDAQTNGHLLYYGAFTTGASVPPTSLVKIASGEITITED